MIGPVLCLEASVLDDFLIPKEIKLPDTFVLMVTVVDSSDLPSPMRHGPLVMLSHVDVVFLFNVTSVHHIETLLITACFLDDLVFEVAFYV